MLPILIILLLIFVDTSTCFPLTINFNMYNCYNNSSTYPRNSPYETNLNQLLSTLATNISTTKYGFIQHQQGSQNDPVYGVAWCRGDMTPNDCRGCVTSASSQVKSKCGRARQAIMWKEQCMLRYSNHSFFGLLETQPNQPMYNIRNVTGHANAWDIFVNEALNKVSGMAADKSGNKYATNEESFSRTNVFWNTMAQCMPDLTIENCSGCLLAALSLIQFSVLNQGGIALTPVCTLRYENYPFYEVLSLGHGQSPLPALAPTAVAVNKRGKKKHTVTKVAVAIVVPLAAVGMLIALAIYLLRKKAKKYPSSDVKNVLDDLTTAESLMFELGVLEAATNNFSDDQKLGQGGFGSVYKGTLPNGQEIAVKRLSKVSSQGVGEFKNEVVLIANLQHRNLVKLLGFCLAGEEKLLVYEYVPNKSLNYFLFDVGQQTKLNWPMRYDIIRGVARGLLYLHEDSRPRIIHRDLKSGNILLDANMNPKIADFGLARIFKVEQTEENTNKVVGTYGYMAPEYAMQGLFSVKSDVYSFGILVLEIVSSKKITTRFHPSGSGDLLTRAWRSLTENNFSEFVDPTLIESFSSEEIMTCIRLGLLCAQDNPNERPSMSLIVLVLNTDSTTVAALPTPQCPRSLYHSSTDTSLFVPRLNRHTTTTTSNSSSNKSKPLSQNQVTISEMYPR